MARIVRVEITRTRLPTAAPLRSALGAIHERAAAHIRLVTEDGLAGLGEIAPLPGYSIVQFLKQTPGKDKEPWISTKLEDSAMNLEMVVPQTSYYDHEPFLEAFAEDVLEQVQAVCSVLPQAI